MNEIHIPVLTREIVDLLNIKKGAKLIDATLGAGGHAKILLEVAGDDGKLLGIDQDPKMLESVVSQNKNFIKAEGNFSDIAKIVNEHGFDEADGILFDLGVARFHFIDSSRGFSFNNAEEPLDMRLSPKNETTAASILNSYSEKELANILRDYGEERYARPIARKIVEARNKRKFIKVGDLLNILPKEKRGKVHPATKVFQALRIAVNRELEVLETGLAGAFEVLAPGGRMAVIAYHSLEDRIVKNYFRNLKNNNEAKILTKKPIIPQREEVLKNPSARSAKLRVIEKQILK
jgi:16S rRNA (cytosine1402-N4)-methyltransferase